MSEQYIEKALSKAAELGVSDIHIALTSSKSYRVEIENDEVKRANTVVSRRFVVTVVVDKKIGSALTSLIDEKSILSTVEKAYRLARSSTPNKYWSGLPNPKPLPKVGGLFDNKIVNLEAGDIVNVARGMLETALAYDERVSVSDGVVEASIREVTIGNNRGFLGNEKYTSISAYLSAVAKEKGEIGSYSFAGDASRKYDIDFDELGRKAAKLAIESLGARPIERFTGTLILDYDVASSIFLALSGAYNGENIWKGSSPLRDKIGEEIAVTKLTIYDDGILEGGLNSSRFDYEGSPRQRTTIIENGVLKNFIFNTYVARILDKEPTGNAANLLSVSPTNTVVGRGDMDEDEIFSEVKRGVYIRRFSGDIRFQDGVVSGVAKQAFYIENGEKKYPVKECMLSGNLYEMLKNISGISKKIERRFGTYVPMVSVENIAFVGK